MMDEAPQFTIVFAQLEQATAAESERDAQDLAEIEELRRLADVVRETTAPELIFSTGS
jgi:hypothetical protein